MSSPLAIASIDFGHAVWRADALACAAGATVATGHPALDAELPGGGWPVGAISEILQAQSGQHEWRLLLPALRTITQAGGPQDAARVVLVGAPYIPFGPGLAAQGLDARTLLWVKTDVLAERLWASELALRCSGVVALLVWLPQVRAEPLRRLQIAVHTHRKLLFVLRPGSAQSESTPAVLRLLISSQAADSPPAQAAFSAAPVDALRVHILKRRGPPLSQALSLPACSAQLGALLALSQGPGRTGQKAN